MVAKFGVLWNVQIKFYLTSEKDTSSEVQNSSIVADDIEEAIDFAYNYADIIVENGYWNLYEIIAAEQIETVFMGVEE